MGLARLAGAALGAVALVARFEWGLGSATFSPDNFFAYLTIQSNIVFVLVTVVSGVAALRGRPEAPWLTTLRASVLTCVLTAGLVFAVLVQQSGARGIRIDVPWSDQVLHFVLPVLALADWILAPGRGRARWRSIVFVLGYALVWGGLTMLRGSIVGWYPYFFLDPNQVTGLGEFALLSGLALAVFAVLGSVVVGLSRIRPRMERGSRSQPE